MTSKICTKYICAFILVVCGLFFPMAAYSQRVDNTTLTYSKGALWTTDGIKLDSNNAMQYFTGDDLMRYSKYTAKYRSGIKRLCIGGGTVLVSAGLFALADHDYNSNKKKNPETYFPSFTWHPVILIAGYTGVIITAVGLVKFLVARHGIRKLGSSYNNHHGGLSLEAGITSSGATLRLSF